MRGGDFVKKFQVGISNALLFLFLFLFLTFLYEENNLVGYFGFTDIIILATAPNLLYLLLAYFFKNLNRYLKLSLLIGNLFMVLVTLVGIMIWFSGWD